MLSSIVFPSSKVIPTKNRRILCLLVVPGGPLPFGLTLIGLPLHHLDLNYPIGLPPFGLQYFGFWYNYHTIFAIHIKSFFKCTKNAKSNLASTGPWKAKIDQYLMIKYRVIISKKNPITIFQRYFENHSILAKRYIVKRYAEGCSK